MRFRLLVLALAMLVKLPAGAQDAAGSWTGEMPVQGGEQQEITFELAVHGSTVTGTATSEFTGTVEISEGTVDGSTIAFKHLVDFNGNEITFAYTGTISGDDMTLTRTIEGRGRGGGGRGRGGGGRGGRGGRGGGGGRGGRGGGGQAEFTVHRGL